MKIIKLIVLIFLAQISLAAGKIPADVTDSINKESLNIPKDVRTFWKIDQLNAYEKIKPDEFDVPNTVTFEAFLQLKIEAQKIYPKDFAKQFKFIEKNVSIYTNLSNLRSGYNKERVAECEKILKRFYGDNKEEWVNNYTKWMDFLTRDYSYTMMGDKAIDTLREKSVSSSNGNAYKATTFMDKCIYDMTRVRDFTKAGLSKESLDELKAALQKEFPYDYQKQFLEIQTRAKAGLMSQKEMQDLEKMEGIINSVFIKRITKDYNSTAVLVELAGQKLILCTKEFIPDTFPCTLTNAKGSIVCDSALISKKYKILALVPREIPPNFKAIKCDETPNAIQNIEDARMIVPTIEGSLITKVSFASKTTDSFTNIVYRDPISININTKKQTRARFVNSGSLVKIAKGATLDRSFIFDFQTAKILSIATDINDDKTAFYTSLNYSANSDTRRGYQALSKAVTSVFGLSESELRWGSRDKEVAFVDVAEISDLNSWEVFSLKKYFDTESYLGILREDTMEMVWFLNDNLFETAQKCKLFQKICNQYNSFLFKRTVWDTFLKNVKSLYISFYNEAKAIVIRANKYPPEYYYTLNRFEIVTLQSIAKDTTQIFEGRFKNSQIETFIAKDIMAKVRNFYFKDKGN